MSQQLCLRRDWARASSSLMVPIEMDQFLVLDAANIAPEGSAFRPLAQSHCAHTSVILKAGPTKPGKQPGMAVMVCQEGDVQISLVDTEGKVLQCKREWVTRVSCSPGLLVAAGCIGALGPQHQDPDRQRLAGTRIRQRLLLFISAVVAEGGSWADAMARFHVHRMHRLINLTSTPTCSAG